MLLYLCLLVLIFGIYKIDSFLKRRYLLKEIHESHKNEYKDDPHEHENNEVLDALEINNIYPMVILILVATILMIWCLYLRFEQRYSMK